jgi:hypothetical protein
MDIIAGILLILANIIFAMGFAYYSTFLFLATNIAFLVNSILIGSYFGAFTILIGILTQIYVLIKMIKGHYNKNLHKEN